MAEVLVPTMVLLEQQMKVTMAETVAAIRRAAAVALALLVVLRLPTQVLVLVEMVFLLRLLVLR